MSISFRIVAASALAAALIAGCGGGGSPRDRIMSACVNAEGAENSREDCACFADNLEENIPADRLDLVADALSAPESERARYEEEFRGDMTLAMGMMNAAKECSLEGIGDG